MFIFGRKISGKIFSKDCAFNDYLLFELKQNIEAKRYLERSFYADKPKDRFLLGLEDQTVYAKDLERFYFVEFPFLGKTHFAQFYLRNKNTLLGQCTKLRKIGFHIEEKCVTFQKKKT